MKGFFSFVRKETLHILRDRRTMLIVLLMPVVQLLLFGFAISVEPLNVFPAKSLSSSSCSFFTASTGV